MLTVGVSEAEAQFASLLERVERGEEVVITREGKPVAKMVAPELTQGSGLTGNELLARLKMMRKGLSLDGLSWKELRDRGRP